MESKYKVPAYIKRDGESLDFNIEGEFVFYVPEIYFERKFAEIVGDNVNIMGMLNFAIFDEKGKHNGLQTFNYPTMFITIPDKIEKVKSLKLTKDSDETDYRLLKYKKGSKIVKSVMLEQKVSNADILLGMFMTGKLPNTIYYSTIFNYFLDNIALNGESYKLNAQLFGILQAEVCRSKDDIKTLFRHTDMKSMTNYQYIPMKQMSKFTSPFASITSENIDESIVNAVLSDGAKYSPLEKIMI